MIELTLALKDFAKEFSTRIEMKQVGFRQEAARLGGIGSWEENCVVLLG
jgi:cell fate regulator YaaT (PSP1 superfamily)